MGILDIFFKKEKIEEVVKPKEPLPSEQIAMREGSVICDYCGLQIYSYEPRTKISGKSHHRKCFKKMKKDANKFAFGG
jgi:hypothetical protein